MSQRRSGKDRTECGDGIALAQLPPLPLYCRRQYPAAVQMTAVTAGP
jgi:hypothetical protein